MNINFLRNNFGRPSPLQVASKMLTDAELTRLEASNQVEYYSAIEKMYRDRVARLRTEIKIMTEERGASSK